MPLNAKAASAVAVGTLLTWSGIRGWSILGTLGDILSGHKPAQTGIHPLTNDTGGSPGSSNSIADAALSYQGHAYSYGGAPGKDGSSPWDCSSFVNFICGVRVGLDIPGIRKGGYDGTSHGPTTMVWGAWSGLTHVSRGDVRAGDIIVWVDHMGIAISHDQMISALSPADGTKITPIEGYGNGPIMCYGRYQ